MFSPIIQKLIDQFSKFPTVGPRTASRFVFYLLKKPNEEIDELTKSIQDLKKSIKLCFFCFDPFEPKSETDKFCDICKDPRRDKKLLCIVEKETDLASIEKTNQYNGIYFILGGTVSKLRKENLESLRINELINRLQNPKAFDLETNFEEIILAINPTSDGEATILYLERFLKPLNKKITRLGLGLPIGGELEYADEETLTSALKGRH